MNSKVQATELIQTNKIDREFFAQYISYARKNCRPAITEEITNAIV